MAPTAPQEGHARGLPEDPHPLASPVRASASHPFSLVGHPQILISHAPFRGCPRMLPLPLLRTSLLRSPVPGIAPVSQTPLSRKAAGSVFQTSRALPGGVRRPLRPPPSSLSLSSSLRRSRSGSNLLRCLSLPWSVSSLRTEAGPSHGVSLGPGTLPGTQPTRRPVVELNCVGAGCVGGGGGARLAVVEFKARSPADSPACHLHPLGCRPRG